MRIFKPLTVMGLAALLVGCATSQPRPEMVETTTKDAEPKMVRITGSRIPQAADRAEGRTPSTIYPLYMVDREELWNTGATSVGGALNHLPFVDIHR